MKKISILPVLGMALGLAGCSNFLYSDILAPVYSGTNSQHTTKTPVSVGQSVPIGQTAGKQSILSSSSIEKPQASVVAIENTQVPRVVVNNSQNNPYASGNAATHLSTVTNSSLGQQDITDKTPIPPSTTENTQQTINHRVEKEIKDPVSSVDQSVKDSTEELTQYVNNNIDSVVQRPSTVMKEQTKKMSEQADSAINKTSDSIAKAKPASPQSATKSLLEEARSAVELGNYDKAASALERAHRIEPGNAKILYDIAQIRYAQGNYVQAQSFASRAANYTSSPTLSKKVWTILAKSRKALGNSSGAAAAAQKAASF